MALYPFKYSLNDEKSATEFKNIKVLEYLADFQSSEDISKNVHRHFYSLYVQRNSEYGLKDKLHLRKNIIRIKRIGDHLLTNEKFLIHFKFGFDEEKFRTNEVAIINQWKMLHEHNPTSPSFTKSFNQPEFFTIRQEKDCLSIVSEKLNSLTFLWDPCSPVKGDTSKVPLPQMECKFNAYFGCHSKQFPIRVNRYYTGSLFVLSIDIYSVLTKQKLDSVLLKLDIQCCDPSLKIPIETFNRKTKAKIEEKHDEIIESNVQDLLSILNIETSQEAPLPEYRQMKAVQLERGYFSYSIFAKTIAQHDALPMAYLNDKQNFDLHLSNLNFRMTKENVLIRIMITFGLNQEFKETEWDKNWKRLNVGKTLLQYKNFGNDFYIFDNSLNELFDVYSTSYNQLCLIWTTKNLSVTLGVSNANELKLHKLDAYLKVESFLVSDGSKIDEALCRLNFYEDLRSIISPKEVSKYRGNKETLTIYDRTDLKRDSKYLVKKALFVSVDGSEYRPLIFQERSLSLYSFKTKLEQHICNVKNIDSIEIRNLKYNILKQSEMSQRFGEFTDSIFAKLESKTILKCVLYQVSNELQASSEVKKYDVNLINQNENYSKSYI